MLKVKNWCGQYFKKSVVFGIKCFNCDTTKLCLRENPKWNKDDIEVVILFPCLFGHCVQYMNKDWMQSNADNFSFQFAKIFVQYTGHRL